MYFINNRQLINKLAINTGTAQNPVYTDLCCATERTINFDFDTQDFSIFCDALKRHVTTGADVQIETTLKLDVENTGVLQVLGDIHTLITAGTITQFTNVMIEFGLLSGYTSSTLTYTKYKANTNVTIENLGGNAEDVGEIAIKFTLNGTAQTSASI